MKYRIFAITMALCLLMAVTGCKSNTTDATDATVSRYYTMADFQTITVGESTFSDVHKIAPSGSPIYVTSYGGFCEFPAENGGCIRIKFYGADQVVGSIEEDSEKTLESS